MVVKRKVDGALRLFVAPSPMDLRRRSRFAALQPTVRHCGATEVSKSAVCARTEQAPSEHKVRMGLVLAEEVGFEPTRRVNGLRDFESRLFDHLSTPP